MLRLYLVAGLLFFATAAMAQDQPKIERALDAAIATFERALPSLSSSEFGVDVGDYRDALTLQRFHSGHWGGEATLEIQRRDGTGGSCGRYAAFVRVPPENGLVPMVLCPQFFTAGADGLRELTILHEMVHVVAGTDECQAMAFAAKVEMAAKGTFTPVAGYWQASGCGGSGYRLPK